MKDIHPVWQDKKRGNGVLIILILILCLILKPGCRAIFLACRAARICLIRPMGPNEPSCIP